jgi:hypothetical protein
VSPTYQPLSTFLRDYDKLTPGQRKRFLDAVADMVADIRARRSFRSGLRVKRVQGGTVDLWELTWAPDGRATWQYGPEAIPGQPHIIWRRIGTHEIFRAP